MRCLIFFFFATLSYNLNAQVPGYMGHRFSVEGDVNTLFSLTKVFRGHNYRRILATNEDGKNQGLNFGDQTFYITKKESNILQNPFLSFNLNSSINLNYSLKKYLDISFNINYTKSKLKLKNDRVNSRHIFLYSNEFLVPYQLMEYSINLKFYTGDYIAPVGNYVLFGFGLAEASSTYVINYSSTLSKYSNDLTTIYSEKVNQKTKFLKVNAGFFKKKFLTDKLYLDYGIAFNFYFNGANDVRLTENGRDIKTETIKDEIDLHYRYNVGRHISIDNRYNFKIGLGIIL